MIDEVMQSALDDIVEALRADAGEIQSRDGGGWTVRYLSGPGGRDIGAYLSEEDSPLATRALISGAPVMVSDNAKEPSSSTGVAQPDAFRATLALPLVARSEVVGVLLAHMTSTPRRFRDTEVEFAQRMAASIALALDNQRLRESEHTQLAHVEVLNEISNLTVSALDTHKAAELALGYMVEHLGIASAAAWQVAADDTLQLIAAANFPQSYIEFTRTLPLDADLDNVHVAVRGEPIVAENLAEWNPDAQRRFGELGVQVGAYAIVPIAAKGGVIGAMGFTWPEPRAIPHEDVELYVAVASQLGLALENARLFAAEKRELARAQLLQDLTLSVASETDPRSVAHAAVAALKRHLVMKYGDVRVVDAERAELVLLAHHGYPEGAIVTVARVPLAASGYLATEALRRKAIVTHEDDVLTPERIALLESFGVFDDRYLQVPLLRQGQAVGVFSLTFEGRRSFAEDELQLYRVVAGILAQAIENARLFQAERLRAGRMEVLRDVSELVASSLDPDQVTSAALESAVEHIGVCAASVWLIEGSPPALQLRDALGFPEEFFTDFADGLQLDAPFDVARVARSGELVVHEDAADSDVSVAVVDAYRRYEIPLGALIVLPLRVGESVIGALTLAWDHPRRFDKDAIDFDTFLASAFSTALVNARLFENARASAKRILEIINSMSDAFVSVDREWRYTLLNPRAAQMFGLSADDLIGKRMDEEFPDARGWPQYRKVMEERVPVSFEIYAESAHIWVEIHAYPTLDGISMYISDITRRKTNEEALDRLHRLLDAHISNSPLAVVEFDSEFRIVRWSDGAERMFGWTADEALGVEMTELPWIYEEDPSLVEREQTGVSTDRTRRSFKLNRNYRKDGTVIWCEWYDSALYDDDGNLVSTFSQVLDVTARRHAEEAVRDALAEVDAERTRLRQIIDEIPVGVAVMGPNDVVLETNDAINSMWHGVLTKAESTEGFAVYDGYFHGTNQRLKPNEWPGPAAAASGKPESRLVDIVRLDGTVGVIDVSALPILDDEGGVSRVVVIVNDVTEQVDAQSLAGALNEISLEVSSTLDATTIIARLTESGARALGTTSAAAVIQRGGRWTVQAAVGLPEIEVGAELRRVDAEAMLTVFQQAQPVLVPDARSDSRVRNGKLAELGATSVIGLPLISHGSDSGALFFWHTGRRRDFSETQLEFARKLMTVATIALDNAHLYEREHRIAETLQEAILAPPERVDGLDVAYAYRPASSTANVGGDFYDVVVVEAGRVGLMVGDVSGKGIDAARFTSLMRNGARAFLLEGSDPASVLERLNGLAWRSTPVERFATAFLGVLDVGSGTLAHAGAGHPSALLVGEDGVRRLASSAGLLGAWEKLTLHSHHCNLAPGEVLVLYTDGVTEARNAERELFGEERLVETLEALWPATVDAMPAGVLDAVEEFSEGGLRDDIVILCVSRSVVA